MSRPSLLTLPLFASAVVLAAAPAASAQTIRDAVKDHVDKELNDEDEDDSKGKDKGEDKGEGEGKDEGKGKGNGSAGKRPRKRRPPSDPAMSGTDPNSTQYTLSLDAEDQELVNPTGPKLPLRLLPWENYLRLDFKLDGAYRGWLPQQYDSAEVDVASYFTWSLAVRGKFFKYLSLVRGYYESNGLSAPRTRNAAVAAQVGSLSPKAAWLLAQIGFPYFKTWEPTIRYESRAFNTTATPKIPVCIVDRQTDTDIMDCPRSMDRLRMISSFETFIVGVRYKSSRRSTNFLATDKSQLPPFYFGVGLMQYTKPYQVTVDGVTLEEYLFDGRFRGAGLALGTNVGGGARRFFADLDLQIGLGEVSLTDDLTLNEVTPDDWLIGYLQGNLNAGYRFVVYEGAPTLYFTPTLSAGGASFHFVSTSAEAGRDNNSPSLNWDFLWSARAALEVTL